MQVTCPCCSARFPIEAALADDAARQAVAAALKLPAPLGDLLLRYIALFRPEKRALSWPRAAQLLGELCEAIKRGQVERDGRAWAAPLEAWRAALEQMVNQRDTLTLPLKSHGYLYKIIAAQANRAEGHQEQRTERQRTQRDGARSDGPVKVGHVLDEKKLSGHRESLKEAIHGSKG